MPKACRATTTPLTRADSIRSVHTAASTPATVCGASAPCAAVSGIPGAVCALVVVFTLPPSYPPFPRPGLCCPGFSRSVWTGPQRYYAGSDSSPARTRRQGLSASFALPSEHPAPNHIVCLDIALTVTSAHRAGTSAQASPCSSRLATSRRRNGFVILQAARSPPVAPHPASRIPAVGRRSYLRLHRS